MTAASSELHSRLSALEEEVSSLRERVEHTEALIGIKRGLEEARQGLGVPLKKADAQIRAKFGIPAR